LINKLVIDSKKDKNKIIKVTLLNRIDLSRLNDTAEDNNNKIIEVISIK
jgi:hypothetical protein